MSSLFDPGVLKSFVERIEKLNKDSRNQWGKMTVSQMVVHAQRPLQVASGELKLKRGLIGVLFGGIARKKLTGPQPFGKNLPTDPNFVVKENPEFEAEKKKLIALIKQFNESGPEGITKLPHPFFGMMSTEQWDTLMSKHLDHHLRQFGA